MGMNGIPNLNFRLPKNFININIPQKVQKDDFMSKYKDTYINDSLIDFSKSQKNIYLDELIKNIIDFRKKCIHQDTKNFSIINSISKNYLLFHNIEKNLIEISYLSKRENRDEKIEILYKWYKNILNRNKILKKIKSKSFKYKNEKYSFNENASEVNNINKNKSCDNIINEENEKNEKMKISKREIRLKLSSAKIQKSDMENKTKKDISWNFMTHINSTKNCANNKSLIQTTSSFLVPLNQKIKLNLKPEKSLLFPTIPNKFSYTTKNKCDKDLIKIEQKIMDSKIKMLTEKRGWEELKEKVDAFGKKRSKFKENLNYKYEMKEMIEVYVNKYMNNSTDINNSKLIKKYVKNKIKINKDNKIKNNILIKSPRIFVGLNNNGKVIIDKVKNLDKNTNMLYNNNDKLIKYEIKLKISGNNVKIGNLLSKSTDNKIDIMKNIQNDFYSSTLNNICILHSQN